MAEDEIGKLLNELTLSEKCRMVSGADLWTIPGCERLGIPAWRVSDGPVGVRGSEWQGSPALVLPGPSAMAATWDIGLVEELGCALGEECLDRGVDMLLAPTVNLHRSPRGGRHFEMFSEDPELTSRIAVAYVRGVQSLGVGACIKHFIGNEQEYERFTIESRIDERTLRELYLRPFEAAVQEAGVRGVMAAYNYVNGYHACANPDLLIDILKREWAFEGVVVSDWGAVKSTTLPAQNGLDLEMPGPGRWWGQGKLEAAVVAGQVQEADVDDKVRRILGFLEWRGRLTGEALPEATPLERPQHRSLARRAAIDSMVLIKNDGLLPLRPGASVALIGPAVAETTILGGGSASLHPHRRTTVLDAFSRRWDGSVTYVEGLSLQRGGRTIPSRWLEHGVTAELFDGVGFAGTPFEIQNCSRAVNAWYGASYPDHVACLSVRLTFVIKPDRSGQYRIAGAGFGPTALFLDGELISDTRKTSFPVGLGLQAAEAVVALECGRQYEVVLEQEGEPGEPGGVRAALTDVRVEIVDAAARMDALLAAEQAATGADIAVVVVGTNDQWESEGADRDNIELPAQQDELVRRVMSANPQTVVVLNCGAPMELPWLSEAPSVLLAWYPGQEAGDAILDVLIGDADPGGRMPTTWPRSEIDTPANQNYPGEAGVVEYGEGLDLGYRWYDAGGREPLVPFGHGCSYTTFEWDLPLLDQRDDVLVVEVPVRNIGSRPGSEVVQIYVSARNSAVQRPPKALAGFAKVRLQPGQRDVARIELGDRSFARWDVAGRRWVVDSGDYDIVVAASAIDEKSRIPHYIESTRILG